MEKTIEMANGQIMEYYTRRDMLDMIAGMIDCMDDDTTIDITYNNGTTCYIDRMMEPVDRYKTTGIKSIVIDCGGSIYCIYGKVVIYDMITGAIYDGHNDDIERCWNIA